MPIEWLVRYWQKAAPYALPFLLKRKVAVQQMFDGKILYRRHGGRGLPDRMGWIEIKNASDIEKWARLHTYSFHPHLKGDPSTSSRLRRGFGGRAGQKGDLWFVMDIDGRSNRAFALVKIATYEMAKLLDRKKLKYLLKFSGGRGFHFMWSLGKVAPHWLSLRKRIRGLAGELEGVLQKKHREKFYKLIPRGHPIIITSSTDSKHKKSILIDEQIVHKNGMLRSPYSVHPVTGLVSVPLKVSEILSFKRESARPTKIKVIKVALPKN